MRRRKAETNEALEKWLAALDEWYAGIEANSHFQARAHCYFEKPGAGAPLKFAVVLTQTPAESASTAAPSTPEAPTAQTALENAVKPVGDRTPTNARPKLQGLLPTRSEARGKIVIRRPAADSAPEPEQEPTLQAKVRKQPAATAAESKRAASDFNSSVSYRFDIDNNLAGYAFHIASSSTLNEDLLELLVFAPPPPPSKTVHVSLAASLAPELHQQEPGLQTDAGQYGMLLRATLVAKVASSKGNLALYINRLEELRSMFDRTEAVGSSKCHKARLVRALWRLLEDMRETSPVVPKALQHLPSELKTRLQTSMVRPSDLGNLAWYAWNVSLPNWVGKRAGRLTKLGHGLAFGAFVSLLLLSLHPGLAPGGGALTQWLEHIAVWRSQVLPDGATLAVIFAMAASAVYAMTTQRLTMPERVALSINDKIETVLDSTIANLMKANMDVQIGRLGCGEPPGLIPEGVARKLDEAFALKELVNSYESTVRARQRHVAHEVRKAQGIRLESHQRVRNAALGVTASFVLLEIGSRIQDHRDLQAGTDTASFAYWLYRKQPFAQTDGEAPLAPAPAVMLDCARKEVVQHQPPSPECLEQWRESALTSSSQLLFLVFLIALLMFAVRVMRRSNHSDDA